MKKFIFALLVLTPISLNAQWEILNEGFNGRIETVDFVNGNVGWLAGWNGTLLKTTDGGENWNSIPINESWFIRMIDFLNESIGWAVGSTRFTDNFYIWKSSDGGITWTQQFSSSSVGFNSLYTIDENNVFAVGDNRIYKTSNGGTNWIDISPNLPDRNFNSLWFQDAQIGVVVGSYNDGTADRGIILRTTNGGTAWNETIVNEFNSIYDLQFLNNTNGFFRASTNTANYLCKTQDMFQSWTIIIQSQYAINSYQLFDDSTLYVTINDLESDKIIKSTNGGSNWLTLKSFAEYKSSDIYFNNIRGLYLVNDVGPILHRSVDGGSNWEIQKFSYPIENVFFNTTDRGFMGGGDGDCFVHHWYAYGHLFATTDSGLTWVCILSTGGTIREILFLNELKGYTMVSLNFQEGNCGYHCFELYETTDAGTSWTLNYKNYPDSNGFSFNGTDICKVNDDIVWVVGNYYDDNATHGAAILGTLDQGQNWNLLWKFPDTLNFHYSFNSIYFDNNTGWLVGESGMIIKYTLQDGWMLRPSVTTLPLNKVYFFDENIGWISGGYLSNNDFQKILFKTTNAGDTWVQQSSIPYLVTDIHFIDNNIGWATGYDQNENGTILLTTDGGGSWEVSVGDLSSKLNSIFVIDNYGWAVGDNGLILTTDENGYTSIDNQNNEIIPTEFVLEQNYPNPFNPSTIISYLLPTHSKVTLKIYDLLGREVAALVNEEQQPGVYEVDFNSATLSSGIYFYSLRAGSFTATKKMILLK